MDTMDNAMDTTVMDTTHGYHKPGPAKHKQAGPDTQPGQPDSRRAQRISQCATHRTSPYPQRSMSDSTTRCTNATKPAQGPTINQGGHTQSAAQAVTFLKLTHDTITQVGNKMCRKRRSLTPDTHVQTGASALVAPCHLGTSAKETHQSRQKRNSR